MTLWVDPAPSMRTSTDLPRRAPGSWARALVSTLMWSAAVFDPALPGRSAIANGSPVPSGPWSTGERRPGHSPSVRRHQRGVDIDNQRLAGIGAVVRRVWSGRGPDPGAGRSTRPVDRRQDLVHVRGQTGDRARCRRVRGDAREDGWLGAHDRQVRAGVPPRARVIARSSSTLAGSWVAPTGRHGPNTADSPTSRPAARTVEVSSTPPA